MELVNQISSTKIIDGFVDLQGAVLHTPEWGSQSKIKKVYEYDVEMPIEPPDWECINYGLPIHDQIFRGTHIPEDLEYWDESEQEYFVSNEYHRRKHGVWIFIKGLKLYIPGVMYYFVNFWTSKKFGKIKFFYTDLEFFWMWMKCVRDPKCYGLIDFKCRQIGDTEKVICIIYQFCSRVRNQIAAMQSIKESHIKATYMRIVHAHDNMIWFMKPQNKGSESPEGGLVMKYPSQLKSFKRLKKEHDRTGTGDQKDVEFEYKSINSEIQYGPSKEGHFDGGTYGFYYSDEFGKQEEMDPIAAYEVIKPALFNEMIGRMVGKCIMTSTVEETKAGKSLKWAKRLYEDSNPAKRNDNGETQTGLYRIFRGSLDRGNADHWGFPQREAILDKIQKTIQGYIRNKDTKGLIKFKRKNPLNIEDVFMSTQDESQFDIEKLASRQYHLEFVADPKPWVRGNLVWEDGIRYGRVVWEPNSNGRWLISKHPIDYGLESNKRVTGIFKWKPGNTPYFCMGVDPYDQKSVLSGDPSRGGICVKRRLDDFLDGDPSKYHQVDIASEGIRAGDPIDGGDEFLTNRYVCTYLNRPDDPNDFYEDVILTAVYYGTDFLPEKNKSGGLLTYLDIKKYDLYLMERMKLNSNSNSKNQVEQDGVTATEGTIDEYFSYITTVSCKWWNTIDHPDLLEQWLSMNWGNRGEKDLGVAAGWCEYASKVVRVKPKTNESRKRRYWIENKV